MDETTANTDSPPPDDVARVQAILQDVIQRRANGEGISDEQVLAANPDVTALLAEKLRQLKLIQAAAAQAAATQAEQGESPPTVAATVSARGDSNPEWDAALCIRCPHCHQPVEIIPDDLSSDISCDACGSVFNLVADEQDTYTTPATRRVGHFELVERLGVGAFGSVWKARDTELDRTVAVKIPRKDKIEAVNLDKFLREARAAAQLKHPNIVSVYEIGRDGETLFIVSELIRGANLCDWMTAARPSVRDAAELCRTIALALHHAHQAGVVHRDLKPGNILIDEQGEPHIADFGLAKREAGEITMTVDGQVLGTPAYMSPEQARGEGHHADRRSDVYSLGVILFELLTGERPFRGNQRMLLHQVIADAAPSPRTLNPTVPRDLETICLKCLEKEPAARFANAADLAAELDRFTAGKPILSRPISRPAKAWRWVKRNPAVAGLSAALLVLLLIAADAGQFARNAIGRLTIGTAATTSPIVNDGQTYPNDDRPPGDHAHLQSALDVADVHPTARELEFRLPSYGPPTITVASGEKPRAVLFILDCSASMLQGSRNMIVAKQTLTAMLDELTASGQRHEVGLWLYGHRSRYATRKNASDSFEVDVEAPLELSAYEATRRGPPAPRPPADLEEVVRLSPITSELRGHMTRAMYETNGFGGSPLYFAIHEALNTGFANLNNPTEYQRQIVVFTDGGNWQFMADKLLPEADRGRVLITEEVLAAALEEHNSESIKSRIAPIRLDVIAYDMQDSEVYKAKGWNVGNRAELVKLLTSSASEPHGRIHDIISDIDKTTEARSIELARKLCGTNRFSIVNTHTNVSIVSSERVASDIIVKAGSAGDQFPLNRSVKLEDRHGQYAIRFVSSNAAGATPEEFPFVVRNREERLVFRINEELRGGVSERWLQQEETDRERVDFRAGDVAAGHGELKDTHGRQILVYPRKTEWNPVTNGVKFHVVARYPGGKRNFTPQPVEALAVVQPIVPGAPPELRPAPFTFFDVTFEPGQSAPMMSFVVPKWREQTANAKQALVWIWFKLDQPTEPLSRFSVGSHAPREIVMLDDLPPVAFHATYGFVAEQNVFRVTVTEVHADSGGARPAAMDQVKVSMEVPPARIHRAYIAGNQEVVHTFDYPASPELHLQKIALYQVLLTRVADMKRNSIHVGETPGEAMLVDIPELANGKPRLPPDGIVTITGSTTYLGSPIVNIKVDLVPLIAGIGEPQSTISRDMNLFDGIPAATYKFEGVAPGEYKLVASGESNSGRRIIGELPKITITESDKGTKQLDIQLQLQ